VEKIINERFRPHDEASGECIVLDGVACRAHLQSPAVFCPRAIPPYFRRSGSSPLTARRSAE